MNFLNQTFTQIVDLFRTMTPGARITAGLLLVAVAVSLGYLFHLQTADTEEYLFGGREFAQSEIGSMEAAFAKAGLAKSEIVGNRIRVPRGQKHKYLAALADANALPLNFNDPTDQATNSDNPFASNHSFAARLKHAKQKELSLIISKMQGVRSATVQFDEIEKGFPRRKERSALVAVQPEGNSPLEEERVRAIRTLVVAAIAGLDPANVAVSDLGSSITHPGVGPDGQAGGGNLYAENKKIFETQMQRKIYDVLAMYPGVVVGVNVELNTELDHRTQSIKYEPKPIALTTTDYTKESTSTAPAPGGRPGAVPNGVGSNSPAQVASVANGPQSQVTESKSDQRAITGQEQTVIQKFGLTPKRITASIAVPTSYFTKVWKELNPPAAGAPPKEPDAAELKKIEDDVRTKIENQVVGLFPQVERGVDRYPLVTVTTYTDLPRPAETPPGMAENATGWFASNWQTLALVLVGLFSLVMLRGMLKPGPGPAPSAAGELAASLPPAREVEDEPDDEAESTPARKRRFRSSGPTLRDELTEMVKEDPNAAASVLKAWIGDAA